jgi:hypothetical protein
MAAIDNLGEQQDESETGHETGHGAVLSILRLGMVWALSKFAEVPAVVAMKSRVRAYVISCADARATEASVSQQPLQDTRSETAMALRAIPASVAHRAQGCIGATLRYGQWQGIQKRV